MANVDVVRDMPVRQLAPVDPDVKIPDSVKAQAAKAESYYGKRKPVTATDQVQAPPVEPVTEPVAEPVAEPVTNVVAEPVQPPKRRPGRPRTVTPPEPTAEAAPDNIPLSAPAPAPAADPNWEHRYHSMKGRYDALIHTQGSMQEQMSQMGDELMRLQQLVQVRGAQPPPQARSTKKFVTDEDVKTYGPELIDLARRAAEEVIAPDIEASQTEIRSLKQTLANNAQAALQLTLDQDVPGWREINLDPRFKQWLRLPNIYSGRIRHQMLSDAYRAANAPLVVQLFKDFITDEEATGNYAPAPTEEQPSPAPRKAAVPLVVLAAPGRAKPAGGDTAVPADKPSFTRLQVKRFYDAVRAGHFAGREVEKDRQEREIFQAQNEGRITG
jgi:hypothetical protein